MKHNLVICSFILSLILLPGLTGNLQAQKDKKPPAKKQITTVRLVAIYDLLNDTGKEIHENTSQRLSRELHHNFQLIKSINAVDPHRIMTKTRVPKKIDKKKSTGFPAIDYKMDSISAHFLLTSGKELSEADKSGVVAASGNAHLIIYGMIKLLDNGKLEFRVQNIGPLQPEGGKPLIIKESSDRVHVVADKITLWAMSSLAIPDPDKELLEKIEFGKNTNYAAQTTWREMEYYLKHNDIDNAILKCKHILSLDPNYYPAYEKLGMIYEKQKAYKLALYYYQLFLSKTNSKDQKSELNSKYLALSRQFSLSDDFSVHLPGQNT
ncbi:MAG: hypothetical protein OEZ36_02650, partial [Spirochaetota bacterium]|nr:hypothetical protein [Spirochaetota bacterium]